METYTPYYATLFDGIGPLSRYWAAEYESLRTASARVRRHAVPHHPR